MSRVKRLGPASIDAVKYSRPLSPNTGLSVCMKLSARSEDWPLEKWCSLTLVKLFAITMVYATHWPSGENAVENPPPRLAGVDQRDGIIGEINRV